MSTSVSPMSNSDSPEKTTISPASASSIDLRPSASKAKSSETFTCFGSQPGPLEMPTGAFFLTTPCLIRPMPRRPMKGSEPMFEICSCSGPSASHCGFGSWMISSKSALMPSSPFSKEAMPSSNVAAAIRLIADV